MMSDIKQSCGIREVQKGSDPCLAGRQAFLGYGTSEIAYKTRVSLRQLYYWESIGLLRPCYQRFGRRLFRRYGEKDLERLLEIRAWLDMGFSLEAVRKKVIGGKYELL